MADSTGAAGLLLKLDELPPEPKLRAARAWFAFEFHPQSAQEILGTWLGPGPERGPYRLVTTSRDIGASPGGQGGIPMGMFNAANTEHFAFYAKLRPFLAEVRATTKYPDYLENLEKVATAGPNPDDKLAVFQRYME